ncbi:hypothetical protein BJ166DRAFT_314398 [Pestalotiopsis sp. NC0098]|nr:hypothetical protein BJ166DRAFT_314398 [Pestalotiopsis sp. NC0098]
MSAPGSVVIGQSYLMYRANRMRVWPTESFDDRSTPDPWDLESGDLGKFFIFEFWSLPQSLLIFLRHSSSKHPTGDQYGVGQKNLSPYMFILAFPCHWVTTRLRLRLWISRPWKSSPHILKSYQIKPSAFKVSVFGCPGPGILRGRKRQWSICHPGPKQTVINPKCILLLYVFLAVVGNQSCMNCLEFLTRNVDASPIHPHIHSKRAT